MRLARCVLCLGLALLAGPAWGGVGKELQSLYNANRPEEARELIERILEVDGSLDAARDDRATALHWLGRLEVAAENWSSAHAAYERLQTEFGDTAAAAAAATELALVRALYAQRANQAASDPPAHEGAPQTTGPLEPDSPAPKADQLQSPSAALAEPAPTADPVPAATTASGLLVGAYGTPFEAAEEAGLQVQSFLSSKGVASDFEATASQALRGRDAVVAYLLNRAKELGRSNLILVGSRWGFREFIEVESYSPDGALLWREKVTGGRALRDKKVKANLMERLWPKLESHVGGPGPTPQ